MCWPIRCSEVELNDRGMTSQLSFGSVAVIGAHAGGNRADRLRDHPHLRRADLPSGQRRGGCR